MADHDVTVTRTIHADTDQVWKVLTDSNLVSKWMMGARVESTWQRGGSITWSGVYKGKQYTDKGEVIEIDPGTRLVHTHFSAMSGAEDKPENYHRLTWQLDRDGSSTKLTLTQSGASSAKEADQFKENWRTMLDQFRDVAETGVNAPT
jgi:uncharacterized protein YndB with AHSA1/START domain